MMNILIDNIDLKTGYGIEVLDYTPALAFAAQRNNERTWEDKSGVDSNRSNIRYDDREFTLRCSVKATSILAAYVKIQILMDYMFTKGVFVVSLRDSVTAERECLLCKRSIAITGDVNIREQNSLFVFKLGLKDVNPNALKFKTTIATLTASVAYTKGKTASIYWGNGDSGQVSNSGDYSHTYAANGMVDVIIDVDKDASTISALNANFSADQASGILAHTVQFTDISTGSPTIWSWNFGDGSTSDLQHPSHIYTTAGSFTVTLQVFNSVAGYDTETKVAYIIVRHARLMINDTDCLLINATNYLLKN
jgi:hypothetical protein